MIELFNFMYIKKIENFIDMNAFIHVYKSLLSLLEQYGIQSLTLQPSDVIAEKAYS